jgi:cell wall-associated NlpC family hydrolase
VHGLSSGRHRLAPAAGSGKFAMKVGLCLCAGQLIAGPLFASAAEAAPAAVTVKAPSVTPTVTESANTYRARPHALVRVYAKVVDPRTGKGVRTGLVRLQYRSHGAWKTWVTRKVSAAGTVTFLTHPSATLTLRSAYSGNSVIKARASRDIKITMIPQANKGAKVLTEARKHTGALYKFAAAGPSRFDCSGFTQYVYRKAVGKKLPHNANSQQRYGKAVSKSKKQVGDLIVFRSGSHGYHAAVYAGGNYMYDSPHTGARVGKHKIYGSNYVVRRLV